MIPSRYWTYIQRSLLLLGLCLLLFWFAIQASPPLELATFLPVGSSVPARSSSAVPDPVVFSLI
jgi:hypothetical protein